MILLKDYDCLIMYFHKKANVVFDASSRKLMGSFAHISFECLNLFFFSGQDQGSSR